MSFLKSVAMFLVFSVTMLTSCPDVASVATRSCPSYENMIVRAGWPKMETPKVSRTMFRESGCRWWAYNGLHRDRSYGLLQINTKGVLWSEVARRCQIIYRSQLYDAFTNLRCGHTLWVVYGWRAWAGGA